MFDDSAGPRFEIQHEVFGPECLQGRGCDLILGMTFVKIPDAENLTDGEVYPTSLTCNGLRRMTSGEKGHAAFVGQPDTGGMICDMQVQCVFDPFADENA